MEHVTFDIVEGFIGNLVIDPDGSVWELENAMETKQERLIVAMEEAERFMAKAQAWLKRLRADVIKSKEGSACKRASMDLTRALAELRRP